MISDFLKLCLKSLYPAPKHKPKTQMLKPSLGLPSAGPTKDSKYSSWPSCSSDVLSFARAFYTVKLKNTIHNTIYFLPQCQRRGTVVLPFNIIKIRRFWVDSKTRW